jgi:hypothetical protein
MSVVHSTCVKLIDDDKGCSHKENVAKKEIHAGHMVGGMQEGHNPHHQIEEKRGKTDEVLLIKGP